MKLSWLILIVLVASLVLACTPKNTDGPDGVMADPEPPTPGSPEAGRKSISQAMTWTVLLCALGVGAAIALVVLGQRTIGIAVGAGSIATTVAALTISQHQKLISNLGLAFGVVVAGLLVYAAWVNRRALYELVATGEGIKGIVEPSTKEAIYGTETHKGLAGSIQSPTTEALVKKARSK